MSRFFYDLASVESYLAAERVVEALGEVPEFVPVRMPPATPDRGAIEAEAGRHGLMALRWPPIVPPDSDWAMLVATYAKQGGRVAAYSLAAFRQAFAAGRDLGERDTVLIAAAAAEMHPAAVIKGAGLRSVRARLDRATAEARAAGVAHVPAVERDGQVTRGVPAPA